MADTITIRTATERDVVKVVERGPQGPAGAAGTGLDTLTSKGDTLYRGETSGERLPIGTSGQILKVSASGLPEWGSAPATGVTSVALASSDLTITGSPITTSGTITANLANSGVTAGTYTKVTVDAKGRVTSGAAAKMSDIDVFVYQIVVYEPNQEDDIVLGILPANVVLSVLEFDCDINLSFPTPSVNDAGLSVTIKAVNGSASQIPPTSVFYSVTHNSTLIFQNRELDIAEGADTWIWDGYKWRLEPIHAASHGSHLRIYPNHAGTFAVLGSVPANKNSTGSVGEIAANPQYFYFCHAPNQWIRIPLASW